MAKILWTKQEEYLLREYWNIGYHPTVIAERLGRTVGAITNKAQKMDDIINVVKSNNPNFKAIYQEYDWCYERYMIRGMNHKEMAEEIGCKERVIQKWCQEKHGLTQKYRQENMKLNEKQRDLIIGSLLGDGHIDKKETQPIFIVSHAEDQKDYLHYKYEILKNLCNVSPRYIESKIKVFDDKEYLSQPAYRCCTRIHDCLDEYRKMSIEDIILNLNEYSFSIWMLDDASRSEDGRWELCIGKHTDLIDYIIETLHSKFGITFRKRKDERYLGLGKEDSKIVDEIILRNIPNDLDIIKTKILNKG